MLKKTAQKFTLHNKNEKVKRCDTNGMDVSTQ